MSAGAVMAGSRGGRLRSIAQAGGGDSGGALQHPGLSSKRGSHEPSSEADNFRTSRTSLDSGLQDEMDEYDDDGEIKKRMMPFFKKFWPHLDKEKRRSTVDLGSERDEHIIEDPGGSLPSINPNWFGRPVEEVDPFIFDDVSFKYIFSLQSFVQGSWSLFKQNYIPKDAYELLYIHSYKKYFLRSGQQKEILMKLFMLSFHSL